MAFHGTLPLAALTTVFTPPCPTSWLVTTSKVPSHFPSFPGAGPVPTCNPPAWQDNLSAKGFAFYSPAICPSGFEVGPGCLLTTTPRTADGFPAVAPDETVAWCVPSGQSCTSDTKDSRGGYWGVTQTATESGALATAGPAIQIRFRDSDLTILETHPLTPGLTLAAQTPAPPPSALPAAAQTPPSVLTVPVPPQFLTTHGLPTTSTITYLTSGKTVVSTVVTAPPKSTASSALDTEPNRTNNSSNNESDDDDDDDDNASSVVPASNATDSDDSDSVTSTAPVATKTHTPMSHTRAFAATVAMSCLLGVTAIGIGSYFFLHRRSRQRREKHLQAARDAEQGGDTGAAADGNAGYSAAPASTLSSVGVGAWVQHRPQRPRWQDIVNKAKGWWAGLPFSKSHCRLTGDGDDDENSRNMVRAWKRRQREKARKDQHAQQLQDDEDDEQYESSIHTEPTTSVLAPLPSLDLDFDEKFGHTSDSRDDADGPFTVLPKPKGIPSKQSADRSSARQSWMARLSRFMRSGEQGRSSTPSTIRASTKAASPTPTHASARFKFDFATGRVVDQHGNSKDRDRDDRDDDDTSTGRASTRWSRGTRGDTLSIVTDVADYHGHQRGLSDPNRVKAGDVKADSWEAFARSHQGLGRVLTGKKTKSCAHSPSSASPSTPKDGLHAARMRMQSVAFGTGDASKDLPSPTTTARSDRTSMQMRRQSRWLSVDSKRLSRFSDGTFGGMDSSPGTPVQEERRRDDKDRQEGVPALDAW